MALKAKTLYDPADEVIIDHQLAKAISPESALVLIAELMRASEANKNCHLLGTTAPNSFVDGLLGEIGYFDYFHGATWERPKNSSRIFLHHKSGNKTQGRVAKELILHFLDEAKLSTAETKALYNAIVECMANVSLHAYPKRYSEPHLVNHWWLLGYKDADSHEVSFSFFDQGVGIPNTIRTRFKDRVPLLSPSDGDLIIKAVVEGHYSRTKKATRGKGLPALKSFIDQATGGELVIITDRSKCTFGKDKPPIAENLETPIGGTLINWTLRK